MPREYRRAGTRTKNQRVVRGGERTVKATPGRQERRMEGRQDSRVKRKRPKEHSNGGTPKDDENHNDIKEDQQRGKRQTSSALTEESIHLKIYIDHRKATKKGGLSHGSARDKFPLTEPEKGKSGRESSFPAQAGMWTRDATYQTRERSRALMTRALPRKDRERERQDLRTWSTALIRGHQLSYSRLP